MDLIYWKNYMVFTNRQIKCILNWISKQMRGLMPMYGSEIERLIKYANIHNLPVEMVFSIRNKLQIQKEIDYNKYIKNRQMYVKQNFDNILFGDKGNHKNEIEKIYHLLCTIKSPIGTTIKIIKTFPEYGNLDNKSKNFIQKIENNISENEKKSKKYSFIFEQEMVTFFREKTNVIFQTEEEIRESKKYSITPDILFDQPIIIKIDGNEYPVRWIDAKNYILIDIPFLIGLLKKQSVKYSKIFGPGAFLFRYGFDESIRIPNVVFLDGSFIKSEIEHFD